MAALNELNVCLTDIGNAYLMAPTTEHCYIMAGDEFGPELKGRILKIIQALYGLKLAGDSFHAHLASILWHVMGFTPCLVDPNVWMHLATKPDGTPYYKYILCYVDDVLIISMDPDGIVNELKEHFVLKEVLDPAEKQQRYLVATIGKYNFLDGSYGWYMLAKEYLSCAIPAVEATWDEKLYQKASLLLMGDYHPERDISPLLSDDDALLFASYIGILQWAVELGQIDLMQSVSLMSQF